MSLSECMAADRNRDGRVTVDEILAARNRAMVSCFAR